MRSHHGIDIARVLTMDECDYLRVNRFGWVGRYLKNLTPDEVATLHSRGLGILPIDELGGQASTFADGLAGGQRARAQALALGCPLGTPLISADATDRDVDPATLVDYLNGFYQGLDGAYTIGLYGSYRVVKYARENFPAVSAFYQTYAWSGGLEYAAADAYQHANGTTLRPGLVVDLNVSRSPIPWRLAE